jgi:Protein of unknown function (DUF2783)
MWRTMDSPRCWGRRFLSEAERHTLNARLVLILANHVGGLRALHEAIAHARSSLASE